MKTKAWIALLLAALLLCAAALAEGAESGERIPPEMVIPENTVVELDLDGDGTMEKVSWEEAPTDAEYYVEQVVYATLADGTVLTYASNCEIITGVYGTDLDGDGRAELLLSGDQVSDDYITVCLHLFNGRLEPSMFADCQRANENSGYDKFGYGRITAIEGNRLTLSGSQDILGTWFGERVFTLADTGIFEFADDGTWVRESFEWNGEDDAYWIMTTIKDLSYTTPEGETATLPAGTKLVIMASDKKTAQFVTDGGVEGSLMLDPYYDRGYGFYVNGEPEDTFFERIPYAD